MIPFNYGNLDLGCLEIQQSAFTGGIELTRHRDGGPWERVVPGIKFFELGPEGSPYRLGVKPLNNPPLPVGNELYIYYQMGGVPPEDGLHADMMRRTSSILNEWTACSR